MKKKIIIAVPHGCISARTQCDRGAEVNAEQLQQALQGMGLDGTLLVGHADRRIMDLNREQAKDTEYQHTLSELLNEKDSVLIDAHSGNTKELQTDQDVLILTTDRNSALTKCISRETGAKIADADPIVNYDLRKANKLKRPNILLEFNEDKRVKRRTFDQIGKCLLKEE